MGKNKIILVFLVFISVSSFGQNRYVVYFTNKAQSDFSVATPSAFLSERAILRRQNQDIAIIDEDLPVSTYYVDSLRKLDVTTYFRSKWLNAVLVEMNPDKALEINVLDFVTKVEYVAPGSALASTLDKEYEFPVNITPGNVVDGQSTLQNGMMAVDYMHSLGIYGEGVWIAVFDSGFEGVNQSQLFAHVKENNALKDTHDFIAGGSDVFKYHSHGSNTWSCIAGKSEDGYAGVAYQADFSLYVTEDVRSEFRVEEYNWLFAAERADSAGVDIINSSLGYSDFDDEHMNYSYEDTDGETAIISQAAKLAASKGMLVVSSAGNSGRSSDWPYVGMPADAKDILTVGAINAKYEKSAFSSIGPTSDGRAKPEVVALGESVVVLSEKNAFVQKNGTSFSSPLVAGFAAGVWEHYPQLSAIELRELIMISSRSETEPNNETGHGVPNYRILEGEAPLSIDDILDDVIQVYPNPTFADEVKVVFGKRMHKAEIGFRLYSPSGQLVNELIRIAPQKNEVIVLPFKEESKGMYLLHVEMGGSIKKVKILRF